MDEFKSKKNKIIAFYERHKRMPSYTEIMKILGFKSKNAVYKLINKLIDDGSVTKDDSGRLSPTRMMNEVPLIGLVEAGIPTLTDEVDLDTVSLDNYLIRERHLSYLLEVKGDSMIDAGIHEGDLVVAERKSAAKEGEIVIAEVDGGWTMKYFRRDKKGRPFLEPANPSFKPIYPQYDLKIAAVVRGVVRKY